MDLFFINKLYNYKLPYIVTQLLFFQNLHEAQVLRQHHIDLIILGPKLNISFLTTTWITFKCFIWHILIKKENLGQFDNFYNCPQQYLEKDNKVKRKMKSQKKKVTWNTIYFTQNAKNVVITSLMML